MALAKNSLTDSQKEEIIAQALNTDEGRVALAQAMVEPIRRSLEYQAVGRKLLMVDWPKKLVHLEPWGSTKKIGLISEKPKF